MIRYKVVVPRIAGAAPEFAEAARRGLEAGITGLRRAIEEQKLSGQVLHVVTGRLKDSISSEVTGGEIARGAVWTDLIYAPVHEFGAVIYPKNARMLRFERGGEVVFARRVKIPARPYFFPTWREWRAKIAEEVRAAIDEALPA